jgi:hypothetical protein
MPGTFQRPPDASTRFLSVPKFPNHKCGHSRDRLRPAALRRRLGCPYTFTSSLPRLYRKPHWIQSAAKVRASLSNIPTVRRPIVIAGQSSNWWGVHVFAVIIVVIFNAKISPAGVVFVQFANNFHFVSVNGAACHPLRVNLFKCQHIIKRQKLLIVGRLNHCDETALFPMPCAKALV